MSHHTYEVTITTTVTLDEGAESAVPGADRKMIIALLAFKAFQAMDAAAIVASTKARIVYGEGERPAAEERFIEFIGRLYALDDDGYYEYRDPWKDQLWNDDDWVERALETLTPAGLATEIEELEKRLEAEAA